MNELDSHLEKTSEIFEIGSVEKKLQPLKVGNKSENVQKILNPLPTVASYDAINFEPP